MGADSQEEGGWRGGAPEFAKAAKAWPFAAFSVHSSNEYGCFYP